MLNVVVSEARRRKRKPRKLQEELLEQLGRLPGCRLTIVPHLYDLAPDGPAVAQLRTLEGDLVVLSWLYPRAAFWVLDANGITGRMGETSLFPSEELAPAGKGRAGDPQRTVWCLDLRSREETAPFLAEVEAILAARTPATTSPIEAPVRVEEKTQSRWYPVIDYDRCGDCLECLNFCVFAVYEVAEQGGPLVDQPDACRDGCPACARICPSQAIMFPEHSDAAIAGGATGAPAERCPARPPADLDRLVDGIDELDL